MVKQKSAKDTRDENVILKALRVGDMVYFGSMKVMITNVFKNPNPDGSVSYEIDHVKTIGWYQLSLNYSIKK